jgi:hypothetical protein
MAYKRSRARAALQGAYSGILATVKSANKNAPDPKIRDYVVAASIFLAHAELENYIADLFESFAMAACVRVSKGSALPELLRSHLFIEKANLKSIIGSFIAGKSEERLLRSFAYALKNSPGSIINDGVPLTAFVGKDIYTTQKYPSLDNLRKVFLRIGVSNVFDRASAHLHQDAAALLESLGSLRTQLAHTGTLPGISPRDVRDRLKDTERFVGAIDRVMFKETSANLGPATWSSHMC